MNYHAIKAAILADLPIPTHFKPAPPHYDVKQAQSYAQPLYGGLAAVIWGAEPYNDWSLAIFAHEAGHIATKTWEKDSAGQSDIKGEIDAWAWGKQALAKHGVSWNAEMQEALAWGLGTYVENANLPSRANGTYATRADIDAAKRFMQTSGEA